MKTLRYFILVLSMTALSPAAFAALIYGSIVSGGAPVRNQDLTIKCGAETQTTRTDDRGSYNVKPSQNGKCTLSLSYRGQALSFDVYSQKKPARYDLEIVRGSDGRWILRRQ